jgi:hypothetical protein
MPGVLSGSLYDRRKAGYFPPGNYPAGTVGKFSITTGETLLRKYTRCGIQGREARMTHDAAGILALRFMIFYLLCLDGVVFLLGHGFFESPDALSQALAEFRQFTRSENDQYDHQDKK